ncbi:MAG TPA: site-specific integrase [Solirubrobacterales bacterium]|nr:site-specific integrase [Solirubrobacterales bacterium]
MADVRRGLWVPPTRRRRVEEQGQGADGELLFGPFAQRVIAQREGEVSASYLRIMHWGLSHLLPYFADWSLGEIDVEAVDAYRAYKVEEAESIRRAIERRKPKLDERGRPRRPLNAASINKTLKLLQWVLSIAVEYGHIDRNPAEGRRRGLPEPKHAPVHLDTVEQIQALLDACAALDRSPQRRSEGRVAVISTLLFAGPRAEELCNLLWRDVDLANGRIVIGRSKTQAGLREIDLLPILRDTIATHKANAYRCGPDDLVFPTATGGRRDRNNLRSRTLGLAIKAGRRAAGEARPALAAARPHHPQVASHLRLDPGRHRRGSRLGDGPARPRPSSLHPACLHPPDAPRQGRASAPEGAGAGRRDRGNDDRVTRGGGSIMTSAIGVAILVVAGIWLFGGLLARWAGALFIVAGSVGLASTGDADGFLLVALGIALWLVGHLLYRMRRGV